MEYAIAIYNTKIDEFVCPPNISQTVAVRTVKLAHRPGIDSTTMKLISKPILLSILLIILNTIKRIGTPSIPTIAQLNMDDLLLLYRADQFVLYYFLY